MAGLALGDADLLSLGRRKIKDLVGHQTVVDDNLRALQGLKRLQSQQLRIPRACPHQPDRSSRPRTRAVQKDEAARSPLGSIAGLHGFSFSITLAPEGRRGEPWARPVEYPPTKGP